MYLFNINYEKLVCRDYHIRVSRKYIFFFHVNLIIDQKYTSTIKQKKKEILRTLKLTVSIFLAGEHSDTGQINIELHVYQYINHDSTNHFSFLVFQYSNFQQFYRKNGLK